METIKTWGMTICFAALAAGLANIVAPKGNLEKVYKFAVSLFFLCCVLVPLFSLKGISLDLDLSSLSSQQNSSIQKTVEQQKIEEAEFGISDQIEAVCKANGVTPISVNTTAATNSSGAITTIHANIVLKKADMAKNGVITLAVKNALNIDVTVTEGESNG